MQTAKSDRFAQPSNRRTGPVMLAALILLAIAIGFIDHLPTFAQEDTRAIGAVQLESNQPGELHVSWDPPTDTPRDYRIRWARDGENFLTWTDTRGKAFPTEPSYTITDLDQGVRYKVEVRVRYDGSAGPWTEPDEAVVAAASTPTATATHTPQPALTATPTETAAHPANRSRPFVWAKFLTYSPTSVTDRVCRTKYTVAHSP